MVVTGVLSQQNPTTMKKLQLSLMLVLFLCYAGKAQKSHEIIIDFHGKILTPEPLPKIKRGDQVKIKVLNINPYLYKISLLKNDSATPVNAPTLLFSSFLDVESLQPIVEDLNDNLNLMEAFNLNVPASLISDNEQKTIVKTIQLYKDEAMGFGDSILNIKSAYDSLIYSVNNYILRSELDPINPTDMNSKYYINISLFEEEFKALIIRTKNLKTQVNHTFQNYSTKISPYLDKTKFSPAFKRDTAFIREHYALASAVINKLDTVISYAKLMEFKKAMVNLDTANFNYASLPMPVNDDFTKINIDIQPRDLARPGLQSYTTELKLPLNPQSFIGFSSGFYVGGLYNQIAATEKVYLNDTTIRYNLKKESGSKVEIGINAMLHTGTRLSKSYAAIPFYWNIALGPGIAIDKKIYPRLFLGLGLSAGDKRKVSFNIGVYAGQVDRLVSGYKDGALGLREKPESYTKQVIAYNFFASMNWIIF
jgi:hypothetical protein